MKIKSPSWYQTGPSSAIIIEVLSGYPTGAIIVMPTDKTGSKPRAHPIFPDQDDLKQGNQEEQVSLWNIIILFILHIISYYYSRQKSTQTYKQGSL